MAKNQINFDINFSTNVTSLDAIKKNLQAIKNISSKDLIDSGQFKGTVAELEKIKENAATIEAAFDKTFNQSLGTSNFRLFNEELRKSGVNLAQIERGFLSLGNEGQFVVQQMRNGMAGINYELKAAHPLLNKIAENFSKTFTWALYSRAVNTFIGSIQSAYSYAQKLDESLNNIRIVTGKSSEEMAKFAVQANKAAKALGASTTDYTNASLIYYQQGLDDQEVQARTNVTVKVANITKQSADEVSEQLTAVWNGYRVSAEEAELYIDKLSAVAANTASDLEELSTAMSKVASAAATMGIDIDQLTAQISTIVSVTRQDASNVGTALKTIYARMGDLAVGGQDEFDVKLGDVSSKLATMGVQILDQQGNMRDLGTVITEVASKWETWTQAQQQAAAVAIAGKRQYNNLIALFNNWDMYESALETSQTSEGTLQKQQDIYMESLEAHLEKLSTAAENLYDSLFDSESFKEFLDSLTTVVDAFTTFIDSIGGGGNALLYFGGLLGNVFGSKLAKGFIGMNENLETSLHNTREYGAQVADLKKNKTELLKIEKEIAALEARKNKEGNFDNTEDQTKYNDLIAEKGGLQNKATAYGPEVYSGLEKYEDKRRKLAFQTAGRKGYITEEEANQYVAKETHYEQEKQVINSDADIIRQVASIVGVKSDVDKNLTTSLNAMKAGEFHKAPGQKEDTEGEKALQNVSKETKKALTDFASALKNITKELKESPTPIYDDGAEWQSGQKEFVKEGLSELTKLEFVPEDLKEVLNTTNFESVIIPGNDKAFNDLSAGIDLVVEAINNKLDPALDEMGEKMDGASKDAQDLGQKAGEIDFDIAVESSIQLVSSLMMLGTAIVGAVDSFRSLSDSSMTASEKIGKVISTLIGLIIPITTGILSIKKQIRDLGDEFLKTMAKAAPLLAILVTIAAIGVAIFAVFKVMELFDKQRHKDEEAAKNAAKAYEDQKKALEETKKAYEDLKKSVEDYHKAQDAIDNLTTGTQEWRDAIYEANQQVIELISKYAELAEYVNTDSDGRMTISQEGLDLALENQQREVRAQQEKTLAAQIEKNNTQIAASKERIKNKGTVGVSAGELAAYGAIFSPLAAGIGAIIGAATYEERLTEDEITDIIAQINEDNLTDAQLADRLIEEGFAEDEIDDLTKELRAAAKETRANTKASEALGRQLAASKLTGNEEYEKSDYKNAINEVVRKEAEGNLFETKKTELAGKWDITLANEFIKTFGPDYEYDDSTGERIVNKKTGEQFDLNTDEGEENARNMLARELAYREAIEKYNNGELLNVEESAKQIQKDLSINSVAATRAILDTQLGMDANIGELTQADFETLHDAVREASDDYQDDIQKIIDEYQKEIQTIILNTSLEVGNILRDKENGINLSNISITGQKELANALQKAFKTSGKEGLAQAEAFLSQYGGETLEKVVDIFNSIDWGSRDAFNNFYTAMKEAGIEIKNIDNNYSNFMETLQSSRSIITDITSDFKSFKTEIQEVTKILSNLKPGSIVSDEDLEKLLQLNPALKELFTITTEGNVFVGTKEDLETKSIKTILEDAEKYKTSVLNLNSELNDLKGGKTPEDIQNILKGNLLENTETGGGVEGFLFRVLNGVKADSGESLNFIDELLQNKNSTEIFKLLNEKGYSKDSIQENVNLLKTTPTKIGTATSVKDLQAIGRALGRSEEEVAAYAYYTPDKLIELRKNLQGDLDTKRSKATTNLEGVKTALAGIYSQQEAGELNWDNMIDPQEVILSQANSLGELLDLRDKRDWNETAWENTWKAFTLKEVENLGLSTEAWQTYIKVTGKTAEEQKEILDTFKKANGYATLDITKQVNKRIKALQEEEKYVSSDKLGKILQDQIQAQKDKLALLQESFNAQEASYKIIRDETIADLTELLGGTEKFMTGEQIDSEKLTRIYGESSDEIKKIIDQYIEWTEKIDGINEDIEQTREELHQTSLEKYELEIQLKLDATQAKRSFYSALKDFYLDEDEFTKRSTLTLQELLTYNGPKGDWKTQYDKLQEAQRALNGEYNTQYTIDGEIDTKAAENAKKAAINELYSIMGTVRGLMDQAEQDYLSSMQKVSEAFADQMADYGQIQSVIEHDMDLINLMYGDKAFTQLGRYYTAQEELLKQQLDLQKQQIAYWEEIKAGAEEGSEAWKYADEQLEAAINQKMSLVSSLVQTIQDKYMNMIDNVLENFSNGLIDNNSFDLFTAKWEFQTQEAERYYDAVNRAYEIRKLENKYNDSIKSLEGNISAQKKLNKLMQEQMTMLNQKDKLSKYDLERANLIYEINLKQLQLEEARANATKMKLVRDASGNYSYQFVADEDKISKLQQELDDLNNNLWNLSKEEVAAKEKEAVDAVTQYKEAIKKAATMPPEEQTAYLNMIREQYGSIFAEIAAQWESAFGNLKIDGESLGLSEEEFNNIKPFYDEFLKIMQNLNNPDNWDAEKDGLSKEISNAYEAMAEDIQKVIDLTDTESEAFKEKLGDISSFNEELIKAAQDQLTATKSILTEIEAVFDDLSIKINDYVTEMGELLEVTDTVNKVMGKSDSTHSSTSDLTSDSADFPVNIGSENTNPLLIGAGNFEIPDEILNAVAVGLENGVKAVIVNGQVPISQTQEYNNDVIRIPDQRPGDGIVTNNTFTGNIEVKEFVDIEQVANEIVSSAPQAAWTSVGTNQKK